MKNINKLILMTSALFMGANAFADDFDSFDDFGSFGADGADSTASKLEVNGSAETEIRAYVDVDDTAADKIQLKVKPAAALDLKYNGNKSDVELKLKVDEDTIKNHPVDVIDEAVLRGYFGNFTLEAGKMRVVWGKGDKLHVLDNFNADDYSDFIIPDYLDRRISTPMVRGVYSLPVANMNLEAVYTPLLPVDQFATDGRWVPSQVSALTAAVTSAVKSRVTGFGPELINASNLSSNTKLLYPDLMTLKYGQFGGRITATLGQVDFGISYYNGWYKQPSFNALKMSTCLASYLANGTISESQKFLAYDKKQTFGLEASTVIWHFNVRAEAAYNLTDDVDGTNPYVHNNSVSWLGGFDIDLPFWNANLNVQETGTYILNGDKCDQRSLFRDVDYNSKGYMNNKIVANITTSFLNDKLAPEVTVMYGIERGDLVVMPKIVFKPDQNLTLTASGMIINCASEDSEFYAWRRNSFASISAKYQF